MTEQEEKGTLYQTKSAGLCAKCGMPYYHEEMVRALSHMMGEAMRVSHDDCAFAAAASGGWDIVIRGRFTVYIRRLTGTKNNYFLHLGDEEHSYVLENLNWLGIEKESTRGNSLNRAHMIDLATAIIQDRINSEPPKSSFCRSHGMAHICDKCEFPIFESEPLYRRIVDGAYVTRHVIKCQPENWNRVAPKHGGGIIFYAKKSIRLPRAIKSTRWTAILFKTRMVNGRINKYFTPLNDYGYMLALGDGVRAAITGWLNESVKDEGGVPSLYNICPRCGGFASAYDEKIHRCRDCEYEFPRPSQD